MQPAFGKFKITAGKHRSHGQCALAPSDAWARCALRTTDNAVLRLDTVSRRDVTGVELKLLWPAVTEQHSSTCSITSYKLMW